MIHNPFQYLRPVSPDSFVGRWQVVKRIAWDLTLREGDSHAIIAGRRCGKSSLLLALVHELKQSQEQYRGDFEVLPVCFDLKSDAFDSSGKFFSRLLGEVMRHVDGATRRRPSDAWPTAVSLEADWFIRLAGLPEISLRDFEDALGYIIDQFDKSGRSKRLVILFDEIDETLDKPWTESLFNQLRSLIYSGDLKTRIRLVFAGSRRFLDTVGKRGSPLWNVLRLHFLQTFDHSGFLQLAARFEDLPEEAISAIWQQSGGHPFLGQYIFYHLWEGGIEHANVKAVSRVVNRFLHEQTADLEGWARGVELVGLMVYRILATTQEWIEEQQIISSLNDPQLNTKRGLTALCYHGIAIHDDGWEYYMRSGDIFRSWFEENGVAFIKALGVSEAHNQKIDRITADTVIIGSSAEIHRGNRMIVGDIRDSSGIEIQNTSQDMEESVDNKSKPSSLPSSGNVSTGNITNSSGVAIGAGAIAIVAGTAKSIDEISRLFAPVVEKVNALPEGTHKEDAINAVKQLEIEARKDEKADEARVKRWLTFLAETAPDAWEVAVDTFVNPVKGVGTLFQKIARKTKEEHEKKGEQHKS